MRKLKFINRSGKDIKLSEWFFGREIMEPITIAPNDGYEYQCDSNLLSKTIKIQVPCENPPGELEMFLRDDFLEKYKIAYVRKGDNDCWFIDPVSKGAKLLRKLVHNTTTSGIVLKESVSERSGETRRVHENRDPAVWNASWEVVVASKTMNTLIVDPKAVQEGHRTYSGGKEGGLQFPNIHQSIRRKHNEYVKVKEHSNGELNWRSWMLPYKLVTFTCLFMKSAPNNV